MIPWKRGLRQCMMMTSFSRYQNGQGMLHILMLLFGSYEDQSPQNEDELWGCTIWWYMIYDKCRKGDVVWSCHPFPEIEGKRKYQTMLVVYNQNIRKIWNYNISTSGACCVIVARVMFAVQSINEKTIASGFNKPWRYGCGILAGSNSKLL